ncbi:MATE family efflux transporter [Lachnobacterium bovis]|uniref:Multidrug export protein MepA n=1 Tax=Lachnobacterium bovis TaxID=140626 RepID=A0A1H9R1R7_9FIRM|nr:MATE family efflux transporter [Lachnobacterium bovis]SER66455.1 Na+-driven multidrug efflux pump [Lachnobacterium bovis]
MQQTNPLATVSEKKLLKQFAIPSIIAMLVSSLYNIVDQFFIGRSVGGLGNAATNIVFPLTISCIACALLFGIGGASAFNLTLGKGDTTHAKYFIGNSATMMFLCGLILTFVSQFFMVPMLKFFGSPNSVLKYAITYTRITSIGFPFLILSTGGGHLVRADGSPKMTMIINMTGAIINTVLDALFVFGFHWGMTGAATATVIGQVISCIIVIVYFTNFKTTTLTKDCFIPHATYLIKVISLGAAPCFNQVAMMIVQIILNKSLKYYGHRSIYGEEIPITCVGLITKVSQVFFAFIIGISQGLQPIASFNYGAKNYSRVKRAYLLAIKYGAIISIFSFAMFQIFPRQIISLFDNGTANELYFKFSTNYFRIFLFFICICFMQPISSNFFTAIGKPKKGIVLSLTRQIIFLLPLILILPIFFGIDGIMFAGPIADFTAALLCTVLIIHELKKEEFKIS